MQKHAANIEDFSTLEKLPLFRPLVNENDKKGPRSIDEIIKCQSIKQPDCRFIDLSGQCLQIRV